MAGPLHFTYDDPETSTDITKTFPWTKSLIVVAHSYLPDALEPVDRDPQVGRFASADHYEPLREVTSAIEELVRSHGFRAESLIDDNRLVDRAAAVRAGVGWQGKSTMVLIPGHGPWALLGSVVTDAPLETTPPMTRTCGTCVACIPACPTGAITPTGLDARRCLSTWLQTPGHIPYWIRPYLGTRIYGCDDCLTSCPPGHPAISRLEMTPSTASFEELLSLPGEELRDRFHWWYIPDRDTRFLFRNLLVAAGNSGRTSLSVSIEKHFEHQSSLVRGHAYWAYARLRGLESWEVLRDRYGSEKFPDAVDELEHAMAMLRRPVA